MASAISAPELTLPWSVAEEEDLRFQWILRGLLALFLVLAVIVPQLPVPDILREPEQAEPDHLARVLLEKKELPRPPEPEKPKPEPKEIPKPEVVPPSATPQQPIAAPNPMQQARDDALAAGVLAFKDDLMDMRESLEVEDLNQTQSHRGETAAARVERSLITANNAGSGGITTSDLSRDAGGPALSGREATRVESTITDGVATRTPGSGGQGQSGTSANLGGRSDASIRRMMDRNKGAIFGVYHRALREDPSLEGKLVFEMVIDPSGAISSLKLVSSELRNSSLEDKILARIRMINFGRENVLSTRVNYSFDFLPYG